MGDWTDGWGDAPDGILARMTRDGMTGGTPMAGMSMRGTDGRGMSMAQAMPSGDRPLGTDTGDVVYPAHLINRRPPRDPFVISTAPGRRIRLRLINAGSDTAYRFAIGGHRLTVTPADGCSVVPIQVDTLIVGMGERYDVVVTAADGAFPVVAVADGKATAAGSAFRRTASGAVPPVDVRPAELSGRLVAYSDLAPTDVSAMGPRTPDRILELALQMVDGGRKRFINGAGNGNHRPLDIHGHTFAVAGATAPGVRKDTVNALPMHTVTVDLEADNPGQWAVRCHDTYHAELGMMSVLSYLA